MQKKKLRAKRMLAFLLGIGLCSTSVPVIPQAAQTAKTLQVGESVKFDFGGEAEAGYISVAADKSYFTKGVEALNTDSTTGYTWYR